MNEAIIKVLNDMAVFEDYNKRVFPARAYRNAVKEIQGLDFQIDDADQVKDLPGIGSAIYTKIDQFLKTGTFPRLEEYKASAASKIRDMAEIKGIGMSKAKKLFENGITTLAELREAVKGLKAGDKIHGSLEDITFTNAMKIGLDYEAHTDRTRMSIGEHDKIVYPMVKVIEKLPGVKEVSAAGSARRFDGSEGYTVGDIDLIIGIEGETPSQELLDSLQALLDDVTMAGAKKISGIKSTRQVDIRIVPMSTYGALLLHATGPMKFNVICRKRAIANGWLLNEYGLWDTRGGEKKLISADEREILDKLGIGWVDPQERKNYTE